MSCGGRERRQNCASWPLACHHACRTAAAPGRWQAVQVGMGGATGLHTGCLARCTCRRALQLCQRPARIVPVLVGLKSGKLRVHARACCPCSLPRSVASACFLRCQGLRLLCVPRRACRLPPSPGQWRQQAECGGRLCVWLRAGHERPVYRCAKQCSRQRSWWQRKRIARCCARRAAAPATWLT